MPGARLPARRHSRVPGRGGLIRNGCDSVKKMYENGKMQKLMTEKGVQTQAA